MLQLFACAHKLQTVRRRIGSRNIWILFGVASKRNTLTLLVCSSIWMPKDIRHTMCDVRSRHFFSVILHSAQTKKKKNGSNNTFFAKCSWLARAIQRSAAPRRKNEKRRSNNCVSRRKKNSLYADEFLRISAGTAYSGKVPCCISKNMLTIFPNGDRLFHSTRCPFDWRQTRDAMTA